MTITTLTISRLITTAQYENLRIELTAEIAEGDIAGEIAAALQDEIRAIARAERERRYPTIQERRWHRWLDEDPEQPADWHSDDVAATGAES